MKKHGMDENYVVKKFQNLEHGDIFRFYNKGEENMRDNLSICCRLGGKIGYFHMRLRFWATLHTSGFFDVEVLHYVNRKIGYRKIEILILHYISDSFVNHDKGNLALFMREINRVTFLGE